MFNFWRCIDTPKQPHVKWTFTQIPGKISGGFWIFHLDMLVYWRVASTSPKNQQYSPENGDWKINFVWYCDGLRLCAIF